MANVKAWRVTDKDYAVKSWDVIAINSTAVQLWFGDSVRVSMTPDELCALSVQVERELKVIKRLPNE